jgi:hypothetical protein
MSASLSQPTSQVQRSQLGLGASIIENFLTISTVAFLCSDTYKKYKQPLFGMVDVVESLGGLDRLGTATT